MTVFGKEYARSYDLLYEDKNYEKECDFIEAVFSKYSVNVRKVLDLGCGTGGHALILAKRGYEVVGIDRSAEMLELAKKRAREANLPVKFIEGDITSINLEEKFDAVIAMFAVMSYQTSNSALLGACQTAGKHLKKGGILIFDAWHGFAVLNEKPAPRIKEIKINDGRRIVRFTEPVLDLNAHIVEVNFRVLEINGDKMVQETAETHKMRFLFPQEIKYFLESAGLSNIEFCPFLKLGEPLSEKEWNMTVIARKLNGSSITNKKRQ